MNQGLKAGTSKLLFGNKTEIIDGGKTNKTMSHLMMKDFASQFHMDSFSESNIGGGGQTFAHDTNNSNRVGNFSVTNHNTRNGIEFARGTFGGA